MKGNKLMTEILGEIDDLEDTAETTNHSSVVVPQNSFEVEMKTSGASVLFSTPTYFSSQFPSSMGLRSLLLKRYCQEIAAMSAREQSRLLFRSVMCASSYMRVCIYAFDLRERSFATIHSVSYEPGVRRVIFILTSACMFSII